MRTQFLRVRHSLDQRDWSCEPVCRDQASECDDPARRGFWSGGTFPVTFGLHIDVGSAQAGLVELLLDLPSSWSGRVDVDVPER